MASKNYWKQSLQELLDEFGIKLSKEKESEFIDVIIGVADMEWEATGQEHIPHPLETVKRDLEDSLRRSQKETDKIRGDFIKNICMRNNCEPHDITLEGDGHATIRK